MARSHHMRVSFVALAVALLALTSSRSVDASRLLVGLRNRVLDPTPVLTSSDTAAKESNHQNQLLGIENFALNMRLRVEAEKAENDDAWRKLSLSLKKSAAYFDEKSQKAAAIAANAQHDLEVAQQEYNDSLRDIDHLNQTYHLKERQLQHLHAVHRQADERWNQTINSLDRQIRVSSDSMKLVDKIIEHLNGPSPVDSVVELLRQQQVQDQIKEQTKSSSDKALASLMELAVEAGAEIKEGQIDKFRDLLNHLNKQLLEHIESLKESRLAARESRVSHMKIIYAHVEEKEDELENLRNNIAASVAVLPDLQAKVDARAVALEPLKARVAEFDARVEEYNNQLATERVNHHNQSESITRRFNLAIRIFAVVREQLLSTNSETVARLKMIGDILPPPSDKDARALLVDLQHPRDSRPVDPRELSDAMCGSWHFNEQDGDAFAIDSSQYGYDGKIHSLNLKRVKGGHDGTGSAFVFNGMTDYIDFGRLGAFGSSLNGFTISLWVRTVDRHTGLSAILSVIDPGDSQVLSIETNRRVGVQNPADGSWPVGPQSSPDLSFSSGSTLFYLRDRTGRILAGHIEKDYFDNKWHNIQWTVEDASTNKMSVYVDGVSIPFVATIEQGPDRFTNFEQNLYAGASNNRGISEGFFDGAIDDLQLFCSPERPIFGQQCCKICRAGKACGDDCIANGDTCNKAPGCACDVSEEQVPPLRNLTQEAAAASNSSGTATAGGSASAPVSAASAASASAAASIPKLPPRMDGGKPTDNSTANLTTAVAGGAPVQGGAAFAPSGSGYVPPKNGESAQSVADIVASSSGTSGSSLPASSSAPAASSAVTPQPPIVAGGAPTQTSTPASS